MVLRLLLLAVAFAAGLALASFWAGEREPVRVESPPIVRQNDPERGSPPVAWLSGRIVAVTDERVILQEGEDGPTVRLRRFAEGATSFHRLRDGKWRDMPPAEASATGGRTACIESLFDSGEFLALRVFLDSSCSPLP
jgi:hypothetical protein